MTDIENTPINDHNKVEDTEPIKTQEVESPASEGTGYEARLAAMAEKEKEEKSYAKRQSEIEAKIKSYLKMAEEFKSYFTSHPQEVELKSALNDIESSGYGVDDKKAHLSYLGVKTVLTEKDIPSSLKMDFQKVANSKSLTPNIKESVDKLSIFVENSMEKNKEFREKEILAKAFGKGSSKKTQAELSPEMARIDVGLGRIGMDQYKNIVEQYKIKNRFAIDEAKIKMKIV